MSICKLYSIYNWKLTVHFLLIEVIFWLGHISAKIAGSGERERERERQRRIEKEKKEYI